MNMNRVTPHPVLLEERLHTEGLQLLPPIEGQRRTLYPIAAHESPPSGLYPHNINYIWRILYIYINLTS
jgi:hypothetical protein